jgi:hypothetical protein
MKKRCFFIIMLSASWAISQNLEKIGKKDMVKVGGGLNYSSVIYNADGIPGRRQPFTWFLNGNLNVSILDFSLPFTFNYSNNQVAYTQPFNIQSFNPTYKWIKGYAGLTSMQFSQYTLAGHIFAGGGIELSPKNFKFAAMYGRLKKAVEFDAENNSDVNMSYKRIGYGATAGWDKNGHGLKLICFTAKDDPASLSFIPLNTNVTPMENTVISLGGHTTFYKKIKLEAEYALSGLTRNVTSPADINAPPKNKLPGIFVPNATSQFFAAFKSSLGYNFKSFGINLNYERVDPEYKTLGAYYFNNDLENVTIAPSLGLMKGKLNLALNTGLQRNNLDNSKLSTTKRWVGSFHVNFIPDKHWNLMASYSNFSTFTKQRPQEDPFYRNTLDTLNFYQLSQNSMLSMAYNFGKIKTKQNILLTANYMVTGQNQGAITDPGVFGTTGDVKLPSRIINGNISHNISIVKTKTSISIGINANYSQLTAFDNFYFGPNLNLGQAFAKNTIRVSLGTAYNQMLTNSVKTNEVFNHRLTFVYNPKFKNQKIGRVGMNISATYLQKIKVISAASGFNEFTGNLGLNYSF